MLAFWAALRIRTTALLIKTTISSAFVFVQPRFAQVSWEESLYLKQGKWGNLLPASQTRFLCRDLRFWMSVKAVINKRICMKRCANPAGDTKSAGKAFNWRVRPGEELHCHIIYSFTFTRHQIHRHKLDGEKGFKEYSITEFYLLINPPKLNIGMYQSSIIFGS